MSDSATEFDYNDYESSMTIDEITEITGIEVTNPAVAYTRDANLNMYRALKNNVSPDLIAGVALSTMIEMYAEYGLHTQYNSFEQFLAKTAGEIKRAEDYLNDCEKKN
ncbi:hypothetical protein C457_13469 [Haloferax prahovense DSM 18310]|uniref:Uncharacterized protein n=1 Tax=Haloferax prahovense (strain DSM 18310 / JCM 13924 / TL6) TaxID=1227461 RepID=M0G8A2_HALPT|nr:hypothetical protein [Haloferax prahovense]ELZ67049.1 hypothetical protein C457_13469 [Haloferax prahovense DSM 18310]